MKPRIRALALLAGVLSLFALTSAAGQAARRASGAIGVPLLRLPGGTDWGYPQPFSYNRGPGLINVHFILDSLLWKDAKGNVIPWLASKWGRSRDGLEYVFRLRPNATWSDGQPVTSADVAFTFHYILTGPGSNVATIGGVPSMVKAISTPDPHTVVFRLNQRFAPFPITIAGNIPIIPQHIWQTVTDPAHFTGPQAFVGSGPYELKSYDGASGAYDFVANPHFWGGNPYVQELQFVPESNDLLALQQNVIDAGGPPNEQGVPPDALSQFSKQSGYGMLAAPGEWNRSLFFNMSKGFPFNNVSFRQAMAYAIDRHDLVDRVLLGQGWVGSMGVIAPGSYYWVKGLPTYAYDPAQAKKLLDSIGLVDKNGDGWRDLPDGSSFQPTLNTSTFQQQSTAEIVAADMKAVGINVQLQTLPRAAADAATTAGNYQMALVGYGGLGGDPDFLRQQFSVTSTSRGFTTVFGYNDPTFEKYAAAELQTVRPSTRYGFVAKMQQALAADVPVIPLYYPTRIWLYKQSVFNDWFYTQGGVFGGYPGALNVLAFVTDKKTEGV
jgi:peptide/nickel transport system substrate-binding protein